MRIMPHTQSLVLYIYNVLHRVTVVAVFTLVLEERGLERIIFVEKGSLFIPMIFSICFVYSLANI